MRSIGRRTLGLVASGGRTGGLSGRLVVSLSGKEIRPVNGGGGNDTPGHQMVLQQASLCPH